MFFYSLREKRRKQRAIENHIRSMMKVGVLAFDKKNQLGFVESKLLDYIKEIDPKFLEYVIDAAIKKVIDSRMNAEIQAGRNELIREKIKDFTIIPPIS